MNQKTLLLVILFVVLVFLPITKVNATQVYVGVQVTSTTPANSGEGADSGKLWCLPIGTTLGLSSGTTFSSYLTSISPSLNPVTTLQPTCPGSTIWSGLLNLTNAANYTIRIAPASNGKQLEFCSGWNYYYTPYYAYNICLETWDVAGENKNCNDICAHYGQTTNNVYSLGTPYSSCAMIATIKGSPCTVCNTVTTYTYYDKNGNCWSNPTGWDNNYTWSDPNYVRICACNVNNGTTGGSNFDFSFIPSGI